MLAVVITAGLALHATMIWNSDQAFDLIAEVGTQRAEQTGESVISVPHLRWRAPDGFIQFTSDYELTPGLKGTALLGARDAEMFREKASDTHCSVTDPITLERTEGNPFVDPAFRNFQYFTFNCEEK
jgi:hypothetical protein